MSLYYLLIAIEGRNYWEGYVSSNIPIMVCYDGIQTFRDKIICDRDADSGYLWRYLVY